MKEFLKFMFHDWNIRPTSGDLMRYAKDPINVLFLLYVTFVVVVTIVGITERIFIIVTGCFVIAWGIFAFLKTLLHSFRTQHSPTVNVVDKVYMTFLVVLTVFGVFLIINQLI